MTGFWRQFDQAYPVSDSSGGLPGREEAELARTLAALLAQLDAPDIADKRPGELLGDAARTVLDQANRVELVAIMLTAVDKLRGAERG